ncbi:MAG TPA: hypothetical protein VKU40_02195 [Thermoanaerobaculia bacterium]|nr:hypothetical protein [Thermoanaerobaculia bacterium]
MTTKSNVTLSIEVDLLREVEVLAAQRGTSLNRLLADELEKLVRQAKAYDAARRRALARLEEGYDLDWTPPGARDELHEG